MGHEGGGAEDVAALHAEVDEAVAPLIERLGARLRCKRGCADCCVDDLRVFEVEARRIRAAHPELLAHARPHPRGACAFLDASGACRIYAVRPYVCRTQGLPLRWEDEVDGEVAELRDICGLNEPGSPPLVQLPTEDCWTLGEYEGRLATAQHVAEGALNRVPLRDLFAKEAD